MATRTNVDWRGTDLDAATIERQLAHLWSKVDRPGTGAVRTSIFNLVVFASDETRAKTICGRLDQLPRRQPSRVIILVADRESESSSLDAAASVLCQPGKGKASTLCHERLVVTAHGRTANHLGSVVVPLLLPELPTYLWWPGQPLFGHRIFHRLLDVADQLVVDSAELESPGDGLADLARLCSGRQGVHDFHWGRLTPWREMIAQFFDGSACLPYAYAISSIKLTFGQGGNPNWVTSGALLLLGWLASQLGWEPETTLDGAAARDLSLAVLQGNRLIPVDIRFQDLGANAAGRFMGIEMEAQPEGAAPAHFSIRRTEDMRQATVTMEVQGSRRISRVVPLDLKNDVELLAEELDLAGHDRLYDVVVGMASRLAGREVWHPA